MFNGNRRHGGSSNSVDGMIFENVTCNGNGLDINPSAPVNSGLRGDTVATGVYGSGWDCEEYTADVVTTNMHFINCTMLGNAKSGLLVLTTGNTTAGGAKARIFFDGGKYDTGISINAEQWSILVTPLTNKTYINTELLCVRNTDLGGGSLGMRCTSNCYTENLLNLFKVGALENATVTYLGDYLVAEEAVSSVVKQVFAPSPARFSYSNNLLKLTTDASKIEIRGGIFDGADGEFKLAAFKGSERGSLNFRMNISTGGADLVFSYFGVDKVNYYADGIVPTTTTTNNYSLGYPNQAFSKLHVHKASLKSLAVYADNAAAIAGGLTAGEVYRTATGQLMVVF